MFRCMLFEEIASSWYSYFDFADSFLKPMITLQPNHDNVDGISARVALTELQSEWIFDLLL